MVETLFADLTADGKSISLPNRDLSAIRKVGWILLGIGVFGCLFMLAWIGTPVSWGIAALQNGDFFGWGMIAFGSFGLIGLWQTSKFLAVGIAILKDRVVCHVTIDQRQVVCHEKFLWFKMKIRIPVAEIDNLYLVPLIPDEDDREGPPDLVFRFISDDYYGIRTKTGSGSPLKMIAAGYPLETLQSLAELLQREIDPGQTGNVKVILPGSLNDSAVDAGGNLTTSQMSEPEGRDAKKNDAEKAVVDLPKDSTIEVVSREGTEVYRVPSLGLFKGSHGLFGFAVLWVGFMTVFTVVTLLNPPKGAGIWVPLSIGALFWVAGIAMLFGSIYMAKQSALIGVADQRLFIERETIFGTKWIEYSADQIASIAIGNSGMEINEQPLRELKIHLRDEAKPVGLFSRLDDEEIKWLASKLCTSLEITDQANRDWNAAFLVDGKLVAPEASQVVVDDLGSKLRIIIPAKDWKSQIFGVWAVAAVFILTPVISIFWGLEANRVFILVFVPLMLLGILILILGFVYFTRKFDIVVSAEKLHVERSGLLSEKTFLLERKEVSSVRVNGSGTKVNNQELPQLSIRCHDRTKSFTLMTGRNIEEIGYVVALLNQRLSLESSQDAQ